MLSAENTERERGTQNRNPSVETPHHTTLYSGPAGSRTRPSYATRSPAQYVAHQRMHAMEDPSPVTWSPIRRLTCAYPSGDHSLFVRLGESGLVCHGSESLHAHEPESFPWPAPHNEWRSTKSPRRSAPVVWPPLSSLSRPPAASGSAIEAIEFAIGMCSQLS